MMDTLLPDGWPRPQGYAQGIAASGRILFVSGQIGCDPLTGGIESRDFAKQTRRALENALAVLRAGGATPGDVVRATWFVTDLDQYVAARRDIGVTWRELFGRHYPAMSVIGVAALFEPGALLEIEVTAVVDDSPASAASPG